MGPLMQACCLGGSSVFLTVMVCVGPQKHAGLTRRGWQGRDPTHSSCFPGLLEVSSPPWAMAGQLGGLAAHLA